MVNISQTVIGKLAKRAERAVILDPVDRIACWIGIWALRRLFGADCETDVREDWPNDPELHCISCDAKRLVTSMQEILKDV